MATPSYIKYNQANSKKISEGVQTANDLFSVDSSLMANVDLDEQGSCNVSFDSFFDIDFNLPEFDFFKTDANFDRSFFDKIDQLSQEMAYINDMLINSISAMECCDIAEKYNTILIPFFEFFAGSGEGESIMETVIEMAKIISTVKEIVEPLECLIPLLPGNPWFPSMSDPWSAIYGYWRESGPLLNKFFSGEYIDMILNPLTKIRRQMQACLGIKQD